MHLPLVTEKAWFEQELHWGALQSQSERKKGGKKHYKRIDETVVKNHTSLFYLLKDKTVNISADWQEVNLYCIISHNNSLHCKITSTQSKTCTRANVLLQKASNVAGWASSPSAHLVGGRGGSHTHLRAHTHANTQSKRARSREMHRSIWRRLHSSPSLPRQIISLRCWNMLMLIWGCEINDGNAEQLSFPNSPIFHMHGLAWTSWTQGWRIKRRKRHERRERRWKEGEKRWRLEGGWGMRARERDMSVSEGGWKATRWTNWL